MNENIMIDFMFVRDNLSRKLIVDNEIDKYSK